MAARRADELQSEDPKICEIPSLIGQKGANCMAENNATRAGFSFDDPRQERIYRRLQLVGEGPTAFYRDACRLMREEPPLASTTHLVAHLLREIESGLRDILETVTHQTDRLKSSRRGEDRHKDEIRAILQELNIPESDPVADAWLRLPGSENEYGLASRAHRDALAAPRAFSAEFEGFWEEIQGILHDVLQKFEERYVTWHKQIDQLALKSQPTNDDARFLRLHCPNNLIAFSQFFDQLSNPRWLQPLYAERLFDHPPEPEYDEGRGTIRLSGWPQSRYLARIAESVPEEVLRVILAIPDTNNTRVHTDFAEAALAMPATLTAELVPKFKAWAESGYGLLLPRKLGEVIEHLALGGQTQPALELARSLLAVTSHRKITTRSAEQQKEVVAVTKPLLRIDDWEYQEILKRNIPSLIEASGEQGLWLLCDLLKEAVRLSMPATEELSAEDVSLTWRPAIEENAQNFAHGPRDYLVDAVRDAAQQIARSEPRRVPALVKAFRRRRLRVFLRMAHYILRCFPEAAPEMMRETLLSRGLLSKSAVWHEYSLLLRECFKRLAPKDRAKLLNWIERGPDQRKYTKWHEKTFGGPATKEQLLTHAKVWTRDRLALISDDIPDDWKSRFSELTAELGHSEHPEFAVFHTGVWVGPQSPKQAKDLNSLTVDELVEFLKTWQPSNDFLAPSPEGLGRELMSLVVENATRFAEQSGKFCGLDPTYVRAVIQGLEEATKKKLPFDWSPVLRLCRWVAEQPRELVGRNTRVRDADPHWGWTLKAISGLLTAGLESNSNQIPSRFRADVWGVLQKLAADPEPTPEDESEHVACKMDPVTISLNAERPRAIRAVIAYALWVKRNYATESKTAAAGPWFGIMPEVQSVLDEHLNSDSSVGVRSVYGQCLPWLVDLDQTWVNKNASRIFPSRPEQAELLTAAWDSYVVWCQPSGALLEIVKDHYMAAIERISPEPTESNFPHDPSEQLSEHLLLLYGWGRLEIMDPLLTEFFKRAPDRIRGHAFRQLGFGLHRAPEVPFEMVRRFKALWEQRISLAQAAKNNNGYLEEMRAFGWWFASENLLDEDWALRRLQEVLEIAGKIEVAHLVAERLAKTVERKPEQSVRCLGLLIEGAKETYEIVGWDDHARAVLSSALKGADQNARNLATAIVNRLDARGYSGFRELLG